MKITHLTGVFLCFLFSFSAAAQVVTQEEVDKGTEEEKIQAAENYFETRQYRLSLMAWESLLKDYPDNPRLNYMAGKCLLNIRGRKSEALPYLSKIENKIGYKTKMKSRNTEEIPVDGHFLLAQALHHNTRYDDAIKQLNLYLQKGGSNLGDAEKKDAARWIQWCNNAKQMSAPDPNVSIQNMGSVINSEADEYSPVISLDENVLYFTSRRLRSDKSNADAISNETGTYFEDVYVSYRDRQGEWSAPELITFEGHGVDENEATVSVSADGTIVYVYMDRDGGGDVYRSEFVERGMYSELQNLGGDICSSSWETHCSITPDGNVLFFTSNRPGGYGGLDIYRVIRLPNGQWSKAEALPPPINTPYDEDAPFIHPSGNILYYSSNCDKSMGEYDVFYANILEQQPLKFSEPVNLGAPVNTPDNDLFMVTSASGQRGYYSSSRKGSAGGQDIFMVNFKKPKTDLFAILKGYVMMVDGSAIPENIVISVNDVNEDAPLNFKPRKVDGGFVMSLDPCREYAIQYMKGDEVLKKDKFKVPCDGGYQEIFRELFIDTLFLAVDNTPKNEVKEEVKRDKENSPAYFEQFFGYNKNKADDKKEYRDFLKRIQARVQQGGKTSVRIEASASRVPTASYPSNDALASVRADGFKKQLLRDLKKIGVKEEQVNFVSVKASVGGPAYANDYDANSEAYRKFQFVKAWAE